MHYVQSHTREYDKSLIRLQCACLGLCHEAHLESDAQVVRQLKERAGYLKNAHIDFIIDYRRRHEHVYVVRVHFPLSIHGYLSCCLAELSRKKVFEHESVFEVHAEGMVLECLAAQRAFTLLCLL